jgi:hypothetical protein
MHAQTLGRLTRMLILSAIAASGMYLSLAPAEAEGTYSCCGDSSCDVLLAKSACPDGDDDCTGAPGKNCCEDRCNDPMIED